MIISKEEEAGSRHKVLVSLKNGKERPYTSKTSEVSVSRGSGQLQLSDGSVIISRDNDLFRIETDGTEEQLTDDDGTEKNARLSPDEKKIAYTKGHNLHIYDLELDQERVLTNDGSETIYNGWASWVYFEEILGRSSKYAAFWWSPDSKHLAFLHFDDAPVPTFPIYRSSGNHGYLEEMHYPKSGDANPHVKMGIIQVDEGVTTWVPENEEKDQYTAWPFWTPDSKFLLFQELNRDQDTLRIIRVDPLSGIRETIVTEAQPTWVEFHEDMPFINDREFVLQSYDDGWLNLYRYDVAGKLVAKITNHDFNVSSIQKLDVEQNRVFYTASGSNAADRHLFVSDLDGNNQKQLTTESGQHRVQLSPKGSHFYTSFSSIHDPGQAYVGDLEGNRVVIDQSRKDRNKKAGISIEPFEVHTDGFTLPGVMVLPKGFDPNQRYPVVFTVYGGPDRIEVSNRFRDYSNDFYTNSGVIRVLMDHRGSGKFGRHGLDYLHRSLGQWEMHNLIEGVKYLHTLSYVDKSRIGITGGSYGGYLTLMALTKGADYFTHGLSLYPVTDWRLYDNIYTERYMDTPMDNASGYDQGSAMTNVHAYKGDLLIVHGTADDNVHMQNTLQFISKMQDLGKDFDLMMYPGERHGVGGAKHSHLSAMTVKFWNEKFQLSNQGSKRP